MGVRAKGGVNWSRYLPLGAFEVVGGACLSPLVGNLAASFAHLVTCLCFLGGGFFILGAHLE